MPAIFNVSDFAKIAVMAYLFIWLANRGLRATGLGAFAQATA